MVWWWQRWCWHWWRSFTSVLLQWLSWWRLGVYYNGAGCVLRWWNHSLLVAVASYTWFRLHLPLKRSIVSSALLFPAATLRRWWPLPRFAWRNTSSDFNRGATTWKNSPGIPNRIFSRASETSATLCRQVSGQINRPSGRNTATWNTFR